ncbi:MAG: winged helix-turn-helix transcriptional regulator [Alphaproteobacteria bacterium]|nr:winged helix-turn-helix transcriptional regulator [Alphaproteobacteria bacterium]
MATTRDLVAHSPVRYGYRITSLRNWYAGPGFRLIERQFGLSEAETSVLFCLGHMAGLRAQDVSALTGHPKNSVSRAVHVLLAKKLIQRRADRADRREKTLALTPAGSTLFRKIVPIFVARQDSMLSALTARERRSLDRLLDKLVGGLPEWTKLY